MVNFNDPRKKNLTNAKHFGSLHPGKNFLPTQKHYPHKKDILTHLAHATHVNPQTHVALLPIGNK